MNSDSENEEIETHLSKLPEKSRKKYVGSYKSFMTWLDAKKFNSFSEEVLLIYFEELAKNYKSSSLWAQYSMLRSTLKCKDVNLEKYSRLRAFLKRKAIGYQAKKAKMFTAEEINTFIAEAPDNIYLVTKVALIMGIMGACHASELHAMNVDHFQDFGSAVLVTVPNMKTNSVRKFTITDQYYQVYKKYAKLRPKNTPCTSFFLNFQKGKCVSQNIGIHKFGGMGKQIAKYLKLPNPEAYTGHSFRKSSAYILVHAGSGLLTLRCHPNVQQSKPGKENLEKQGKKEPIAELENNLLTDHPKEDDRLLVPETKSPEITKEERELLDVFDNNSLNFHSFEDERFSMSELENEQHEIKTDTLDNNSILTTPATSTVEDDQYTIFGNFIASEMRNLTSEYLRKKMKRKIHQVILEIMDEDEESLRPNKQIKVEELFIDSSSCET